MDALEPGSTNDGPPHVEEQRNGGSSIAPNPCVVVRYRGVYHERQKGLWRSRIYHKGRHITLGRFSSAELAARAHDEAVRFVFGPRAQTNFRWSAHAPLRSLPFQGTVMKHLLALREQAFIANALVSSQQDARSARAKAAVAAFASACANRPRDIMKRRWVAGAWQALVLTAVRL